MYTEKLTTTTTKSAYSLRKRWLKMIKENCKKEREREKSFERSVKAKKIGEETKWKLQVNKL